MADDRIKLVSGHGVGKEVVPQGIRILAPRIWVKRPLNNRF